MLYKELKIGNKEYKLRINTRDAVMLEKSLGGINPLAIFGGGERIPTITEMVTILHASLQQYHHGITLDDTYDIFDEYLNDGHTTTNFITVIVDVYKVSGIIQQDKKGTNEKNG